jgi:hypothetical protein
VSITDTLLSISGTKGMDVPAVLGAIGERATFRQISGKRFLTMIIRECDRRSDTSSL